MGKCGVGMKAKEIAYANLQKLYSKLWYSASIQYTLNMNIIYLFLTKARVMSDSVNCNFARCAVRHFVSAHLTKNHVLPRGALPHIVRKYNSHFANESSLQVKYSVASKRFTTITKCFNEKWHPKEMRETYIFNFNNEAWKSLSQAEKDKHTLSGCKACQEKYPEVVNTFPKLAKHRKKRVALPQTASPAINLSKEPFLHLRLWVAKF